MTTIRRASPEERPGVVATVTEAFAADPAWAFLHGDEYDRLAPLFAGVLFDLRADKGNVWVSDDLSTVAMWDRPEGGDGSSQTTERAWARYRAAAGEQPYQRLLVYEDAVAAAAPPERHWYLGVLATRPQRRREGLASAVIEPVLSEADRKGLPCCLETSTAANRRFYERRGFVEATDVSIPGGPPTWWLRRAPAQAERAPEGIQPAG